MSTDQRQQSASRATTTEEQETTADPDPDHLDRTYAALTEAMTVMSDLGRARNAPDLFLVNSGSGSEYLVDVRQGACECKSDQYHDGPCKHRRRVAFTTGRVPIPAWIDREAIDSEFGTLVDGQPEYMIPDGGVVQARFDDGAMADPDEDPFAVSDDDEPRTKRAKREAIDVAFLEQPGRYEIHSASDSRYEVDVLEETCSCPDIAQRCKHLRRVDIEIRNGLVPRPDGKLPDA